MIPGATAYRERDEASKRAGGPHNFETNAWTTRNQGSGGNALRGSMQPWANCPLSTTITSLRATTAPSVPNLAKTSTAETDVASWESRLKASATRGQPNPNYTTVQVPFSPEKWSTGNIDRPSWEARGMGGRGQNNPWATTGTMAPRGGTAPLPLSTGVTAQYSKIKMSNTSTAAFDVGSWENRVGGGQPVSSGTMRGHAIPNMRGLRQGDLKLTQPVPCAPKQSRRTVHESSTAEGDVGSWLERVQGPTTSRTGRRGQPDPYAQTFTESTARPTTPGGSPGYQLTGSFPKGSSWNYAGIFSSTAATDIESWQERLGQTSRGRQVMSDFTLTGVL
eukprot:gene16301-22489_t